MDTSIKLDVDFSEVIKFFNELKDLTNTPEMREALADCGEIVEEAARANLQRMVYDEPETWYRRNKERGLYSHTKAQGVELGFDYVVIGVATDLYYAPFVHFGTGLYAENGMGRKTPWVYPDGEGKFHRTVGVHPKPYLTKALQDSIEEIETRINEGIIKLAKRIGVEI